MINDQTLELYIYVDGINDVPFFSGSYEQFILSNGEQFVTSDNKVFNVRALNEDIVIHAFTYNAKRMGSAPTITTTIKYPQCLDELFSEKVYAIFNREKYFLVATPSSSYSNEEIMYKHEATFVSERIALENTYYYDVVPENAETDEPVSNNSDFVLSLKIDEFVPRMNYSLQYAGLQVVDENGEYVSGYRVVLDDDITSEEKFMSIENKFFSEVLQEVYNTYDLPYYFVGKEIHIGYSTNAISEVFRYGDSDALVSITKSNANNRIINRATGIGSGDNIPYYYPNVSPEGDIRVQLDANNTGLTSLDDIRITNYELFAKNLIMNQVAELYPSTQTVQRPFDFYGFFQDRVQRSIRTEPNKLSNKVTTTGKGENTTYYISYNITNVDKTFIGDSGYLDQVLPDSVSWATLGDMRPSGVLPTLRVIKCNGEEEDLSKFKVSALKVYWILEKFSTDYVDDSYNFDVIKTQELTFNDKYGYYEYPNFNEALDYVESESLVRDDMGASTIKFEWEIIAPAVEYEIEVGFEVSDFVNPVWKVNGNVVQLQNIGIAIDGTTTIGDKFQKVLGDNGWINPQKTLMPPIYRETLGAQRFYDAVSGVHIIPDENGLDSGLKYEFENEYNGHNPKEQIVQFEEIKPTIKEMQNSEGLRIDMFSEIAFDENDNDEMYEAPDGTMKYKHPLFFAKLRKLDFNLFDSAIDSGEMTFAMTDGSCSACEFKVAVDEDSKRNTVRVYTEDTTDSNGVFHASGTLMRDDDGNVLCGLEHRLDDINSQDSQQDTINNEVWIALYKDKDTFGVIMPNVQRNLVPKACSAPTENDGDTFVILNISLPQRYIEYAEEQLEQQIIYFIYDNNREKFNFSVKFSRIYFAEHPEILSLLDENSRITVEYNGVETQLYVSSITYKTTENDVLPEITVELKDEVTVTQNQVQKATNQLKAEIYRTLYGMDVVAQGTRVFLRKDQPDTALQPITFKSNTNLDGGATVDKKIESKDYFEGSKGFSIRKDENNQWHIETDYLHARKKFSAKEVEIQKVYHISGAQIKSSASMICSRVADLGDSYRCWFDANDDDGNIIYNQFIVGDQAYVQTFNLIDDGNGNTTNHFYWRLVMAVDANSITLSKTNCIEGSTIPMVGDHIVQLGYQGNDRPERQVAVIDAGAGEGAPYYRQFVGINSFELPNPETQLKPNDNILTGKLTIQSGSSGLDNLDEWSGKQQQINNAQETANSAKTAAENITNYVYNTLLGELENLQNQIDGKVESYFGNDDPTLDTLPASEWIATGTEADHLNDTFTNTETGRSWRWLLTDDGYQWVEIADSQASEALALASKALDTADGKRTIFVDQPIPPYQVGDLWVRGAQYRILVCKNAKPENAKFDKNDWFIADDSHEYADSSANAALEQAKNYVDNEMAEANEAIARIESWAEDGYISPIEKQSLKTEKSFVETDFIDIEQQYVKYIQEFDTFILTNGLYYETSDGYIFNVEVANANWIAYRTTYNSYIAELNAIISSDMENVPVGNLVAYQSNYYDKKRAILEDITLAIKAEADYSKTKAEKASTDVSALREEIKDTTDSIDATIKELENNQNIGEQAIAELRDELENAKSALEDVYDQATIDEMITESERKAIAAALEQAKAAEELANTYANAYADGRVEAEEAARIAEAEANLNAAKAYAEEKANEAYLSSKAYIDAETEEMNAAISEMQEWAGDDVISPVEKQALANELANVQSDYNDIVKQYEKYIQEFDTLILVDGKYYVTSDGYTFNIVVANQHWEEFVAAYEVYVTDLQNKINAEGTVPIGDLEKNQSDYYSAKTPIIEDIALAIKAEADYAKETAQNAQNSVNSLPIAIDADGAILSDFLGIKDANDNIVAGIDGGNHFESVDPIMIFAGADSLSNVENANFKVTKSGKVVANNAEIKGKVYATEGTFDKGTFTNADVSGKVNATSGSFKDGTFNNVTINGSISSPLQAFNGTTLRISVTGQIGYAVWQRDTSKDKVFLNVQYYAWVDLLNNVFYSKETDVYVGFNSFYTLSNISAMLQTSYTIALIENAMAGNDGIDKHDNLAINVNTNEDRHIASDELDWSISNSGRIVRFVNAPFEGLESKGFAKLYAPNGKYFFEDGERYSTIAFSNQIVELLGYGDAYDFYGWIVLNRKDISTLKSYGAPTNVLYQGVINNNVLTKFWSAQIEKTRSGHFAYLDGTNGIITILVKKVGSSVISDYRGLENVNNWAVMANGATVSKLQYLPKVEISLDSGVTEDWECIRFDLDYSDDRHVVFQVISTANWASMTTTNE